MPGFVDFIAPFDANRFKTEYFGRQPLHVRNPEAATRNPLPWRRFNEALALQSVWNEDTLKVFYRSHEALRENYCNLTDVPAGGKAPADPRKVRALLGLGASLVANSIHRVCPEVEAISQMLQREFAASAGANAYCSFGQVQAFNTHYDLHDVFALQVEGEKTWNIYEARAENPVAPLPPGAETDKWLNTQRGRIAFVATMRPGDILYLPRGQFHDALTGADASLHLTFWVRPATGLGLVRLLENVAAADPAFRAFLPDARDPRAIRSHLDQLGRGLLEILQSPSFLLDVENHQRGLGSIPADYSLPEQQSPHFFSTAVRGRVTRRRDDYFAILEGTEMPLGKVHPAVAWLLQQKLFSKEDLLARFPFVDEAELSATLDRLLRAGAIVATEMR